MFEVQLIVRRSEGAGARLILSTPCFSCGRSARSPSRRGLGVVYRQPVTSASEGHPHTHARTHADDPRTPRGHANAQTELDRCWNVLTANATAGDAAAPHARRFARVICTERKHGKWHLTSQRSHFVYDRGAFRAVSHSCGSEGTRRWRPKVGRRTTDPHSGSESLESRGAPLTSGQQWMRGRTLTESPSREVSLGRHGVRLAPRQEKAP